MQPAMPFVSLTLITGTLMTLSTSLERIFEKRHLPCVADILKIAPHQFPDQRSRLHCLGVVSVVRRDCFYLVAINRWPVSGLLDSAEGAVPNDDATAGMTRRRQTIHDRVHNVMVCCEKLATRRRDLDTNALAGRDQ